MRFQERRNKVISQYDSRIESLEKKKAIALETLQKTITTEAAQASITCNHCKVSSLAPHWKFTWAQEYSESASRGPWSEPISGWVNKSMIQSLVTCPHCNRTAIIAEHKDRDRIMEILQSTDVIKKFNP